MLVNNNKITIYQSDTQETIKDRIAMMLKSTPYWTILTPDGDGDDVTAVNVLEELKKYVGEPFSEVELMFPTYSNDNTKLAEMFIVYNMDELGSDIGARLQIASLFFDPNGTTYDEDFIDRVSNQRDAIVRNIAMDIRDHAKKTMQQDEELLRINSYMVQTKMPDFRNTEFVLTHIVSSIKISVDENRPVVLAHLFNDIDVDDDDDYGILFAKYNDVVKVPTRTDILMIMSSYDFDNETKDGNSLQIVKYRIANKNNKYLFEECVVSEVKSSDTEFVVDIDNFEKEEQSLATLRDLLPPFQIDSVGKTYVKGTFTLADTSFFKELFTDEIMNNKQFYMMYTNERYRIPKNVNRINIYFYTLSIGQVNFVMFQDGPDVRINIFKAQSEEKVREFIKVFQNLFSIYKSKEALLISVYNKFIPQSISKFTTTTTVTDKTGETARHRHNNDLAMKEPALFVPLYTRKCAKPPRILDDDDKVPDGYEVLEFPLHQEGGLRQRRYVCDRTKNFKFPGLRRNTLPNNNVFKYIPCCYETDQLQRKGSPLNAYLAGAEDKADKYEHSLYKTMRVLPNGNKGLLPIGLARLFGKSANRMGVHLGVNSFIDCIDRVAKGTVDTSDAYERSLYLEDIRKNKLSWSVCTQDNWDMKDLDQLRTWFRDNTLYFEPRRFYRALEVFYKINIYLFERNADHAYAAGNDGDRQQQLTFSKNTDCPDGAMVVPNTPPVGLYIDPKPYNRNAYVYIHMGGAVDILKYPHCEYIVGGSVKALSVVDDIYRHILVKSRRDTNTTTDTNTNKNWRQYIDGMGRVVLPNKITKPPTLPIANDDATTLLREPDADPDVVSPSLQTHLYFQKYSRILVEYFAIKISSSSTNQTIRTFMEKSVIIDASLPAVVLNTSQYLVSYYDSVFEVADGKYRLDSEDTKMRLIYILEKLSVIGDLSLYTDARVLRNIFKEPLDFNGFVIPADLFRVYAYQKPQGYAMNDYLEQPSEPLVYVHNSTSPELNGYYKTVSSIDQAMDLFGVSVVYLWDGRSFDRRQVIGNGLSANKKCIVYRIDGETHILAEM